MDQYLTQLETFANENLVPMPGALLPHWLFSLLVAGLLPA